MSKLDFLFKPNSVAVIGASNNEQKIGHAVIKNLVECGYQGTIVPINPKEEKIFGLKCAPSIKDAGQIDTAVITVPEKFVEDVAKECGESGVKGLIVITAGFKEVGHEGLKREKRLRDICTTYHMRMLGPNCVGLIDTHTPLNASFTPGTPYQGNIAFISQSGAMLMSILDWSFTSGIGFSQFVSLGNKANLNEIDFVKNAAEETNTKVILCYIEDVVEGERFLKTASEASKKKPIIILKSGASASGAQAASSHTGALAGSDTAYEIAFRQSGVLRAQNMNELFELAVAFSRSPISHGDKVAIITNSGGPGIVATDAVEKSGLSIARFQKETIELMQNNLPPEANIYNPVDVLGDARPERYHFSLEAALADNNVDNVIVLLTPAAIIDSVEVAQSIIELQQKYYHKPILAVYMGGKALEDGVELLHENQIPTYTFPEQAVNALQGLVNYARFKEKEAKDKDQEKQEPVYQGDQRIIKSIFYDALKEKRLVLRGDETSQIAEAYGIPVNKIHLARSAQEAKSISETIGYPLVMKISSPDIIHKSDVGGIKLGLHSAEEVEKTYERMIKHVKNLVPEAPIFGVELQKMAEDGPELIIGMTKDVQFGPMIAFGLGGIYVNLIEDVSFRLASALTSRLEVDKMIQETKAYTLLKGYRGKKKADLEALKTTIQRTAQLVMDFDEINEMDMNPLRVYQQGALALDIKITIEHLL